MAVEGGPPVPAITEPLEEEPEDEPVEPDEESAVEYRPGTIEHRIDQQIGDRLEPVDRRLEELEETLSELDNYARISLSERRIKQNEENLEEFSDSLTAFAERTMSKANGLEERLQVQTMLLTALLEALEDAEVEVDLSAVEQYTEERVVTDSSRELLEAAIERHS